MLCPSGHENREGAAFCIDCGAKLALVCKQCGRALPPSARFCDGCGLAQDAAPQPPPLAANGTQGTTADRPVAAPPAPPPHLAAKILRERGGIEGERRTVTVLFIDAVGHTAAGEKLDAEALHRIIQHATERMIEAVNRFEGTVTQFRGDGIMAVFGAPIAHEDSARRAVAAALAMRESLDSYGEQLQRDGMPAWSYRIGLNTGPVIVGSIGSDFSMDYTAIGDTVNLAARMEQTARPGAIYLTEDTKRHVAPYFELIEIGPVEIKGKSETVNVFEVVRELASRSRLEVSAERGLTPYVGREDLLESLLGHFASARMGEGRVVFIQGEPGMGKSRLLLEFRRQLGEDVAWFEGRCISWGKSFPYLPIVDIVRDTFGVDEGDDDARISAAIEEHVSGWDASAAASAVPQLKYLLNMDSGDGTPAMDPSDRRKRVLDALRALLMQESSKRPVVVTVEDLHWADEQSEDALAALVDAVASSPVLLILTYRPGYAHTLGDRTYYGRLVLRNLPVEDSAAMVHGVLHATGIPARLQEMIVEKAEGNPFFIEEVSRSLVESGVLRRTGERYTLVRPVEQVTIPDTIQEVILSRIDRLQRRAKEAVQYASVIGREFPVRLLKHIAYAEEGLDALLGELKALELIYEKSYFPELEYMFKHALTQEVALSTLLADRRKALHRTVAAAIEELYADRIGEQHEALAYHYYEGEEWEKACHYAAMVARRAADLYAPRAVISHATRAIEAAKKCDPDCCEPIEPQLFRMRGQAYEAVGEFDLSRADHEAAIGFARQTGDQGAEWQAHADLGMLWAGRDYARTGEYFERAYEIARQMDNESLIARSLNRLGNWRLNIDHPIESVQHHEQALAIFRRMGDPQGTAETLDFLSMAHALSGDMDNAVERGIEGIELYRELGDRQGLAGLLPTVGFSGLSGVETLTISPAGLRVHSAEFATWGQEALQIAREISSMPAQAFALCQQCAADLSLGNYGQALESAQTALEIATEIGHIQWQVFSHYNLGCAYLYLFQYERAIHHLQQARALAAESGSVHWILITDSDYVRCLARAGDLEQAAEVLAQRFAPDLPMISLGQRGVWLAKAELHAAEGDFEQAVRLLDRLGATAKNAEGRGVQAIPYLSLARGEYLLALNRLDAAEADLRATLEVAEVLSLKPMRWRAIAALGERLVKAGRDDDARRLFAQALTIVEETAATIGDAALRHLYLISAPVERLRAHTSAGAL